MAKWFDTRALIRVLSARAAPAKWRTLFIGKQWAVVLIRNGQGETQERDPGQ